MGAIGWSDVMSALPVVGPIIGGALNANAQKATNKYNLQAVRETNAQNAEIARAQLQQQQAQFERQLEYLSPSEQRKSLEQAGFNPAAYLSGGQTSSAGTPHSGVSQQMIPGHVDPVTGFGNALMEMSSNLRNIAEAKKLDSERKGQDLQNETFMFQFEKTMEALGYSNKIAEVKAKYAGQEEEQFYKQLVNDNLFKQEEIERVQIANKIQREYNEKIQPQELNKLLDEIALLKEEKITQQHLQSYYKAAGKAGLTNAAANSLRAWIEQKKMPEEIESLRRSNERMRQENAVYHKFGAKTADAILDAYNKGAWKSEEEAHAYLRKNAGLDNDQIGQLKDIAPFLFGMFMLKGVPGPIKGFGR